MARSSFDNLPTEKFRKKLRPAAERIYERIWPGCKVNDLREEGVKVHVLDKEFGIDTLAEFESGQWISIQEKFRQYKYFDQFRVIPEYPDFTQEYMNAAGTKHENPGEWFKLGAQLYFYGWANKAENDFHRWMILDVAVYKQIVEEAGGLDKIGELKTNRQHGSATFYAIPTIRLSRAVFISDRSLFRPATYEIAQPIRR